jgi:copper transport protein
MSPDVEGVRLDILMITLGALNRRRVLPALKRLAGDGAAPGDAGRLLRRTLRAEVGLIVAVLAISGALTGYPPPTAAATGPVSISHRIGPLDLDLTIDAARTGVNEVHLSTSSARRQARRSPVRRSSRSAPACPSEASARSRSTQARPAPATTSPAATLSPGGDWELLVAARVSKFDEHATTAEVTVR